MPCRRGPSSPTPLVSLRVLPAIRSRLASRRPSLLQTARSHPVPTRHSRRRRSLFVLKRCLLGRVRLEHKYRESQGGGLHLSFLAPDAVRGIIQGVVY